MRHGNQIQTFLFFKKALYKVKASGQQLSFNISIALNVACNTTNFIRHLTVDPDMCSILIFQKRLWEQCFHHILCIVFQNKCFSIFYYINRPNLSTRLPLLLKILGCYIYIAIVCFPCCGVINFKINFIFQIKTFFYLIKNSIQKFKSLENERSF